MLPTIALAVAAACLIIFSKYRRFVLSVMWLVPIFIAADHHAVDAAAIHSADWGWTHDFLLLLVYGLVVKTYYRMGQSDAYEKVTGAARER